MKNSNELKHKTFKSTPLEKQHTCFEKISKKNSFSKIIKPEEK